MNYLACLFFWEEACEMETPDTKLLLCFAAGVPLHKGVTGRKQQL